MEPTTSSLVPRVFSKPHGLCSSSDLAKVSPFWPYPSSRSIPSSVMVRPDPTPSGASWSMPITTGELLLATSCSSVTAPSTSRTTSDGESRTKYLPSPSSPPISGPLPTPPMPRSTATTCYPTSPSGDFLRPTSTKPKPWWTRSSLMKRKGWDSGDGPSSLPTGLTQEPETSRPMPRS